MIKLTKLDKLKVAEREKALQKAQADIAKFIACHPVVLATSSEKGWGLADVKAEIADLAR